MNDCLNLQELFGARFVVRFDPAYDPWHVQAETLDPWMMVMQSRFGTIYPHGGHQLGVEVEGRPSVRKRLDRLDCCRPYIRGERFATWLFSVRDFERVAEVVRPAKKRTWTGAERKRSADTLKANINKRLDSRTDSRFSSAVCVPMGRGDSRAVQAGETRQ